LDIGKLLPNCMVLQPGRRPSSFFVFLS
jgi:hypothetical protein